MSERREFVEVERLGNMARYSVTAPIEVDPIYARIDELDARIDELEQRISDAIDAALCDFKHAEHCVNALERRIVKLEADMFAQHAIAMNHSDSIEHIERKLQHKGGAE